MCGLDFGFNARKLQQDLEIVCLDLDDDSLNLIQSQFIVCPVIKLRGARRFVCRDLLRHFDRASVLQVRRDARRTERVAACVDVQAGSLRPAVDHP